MSVTVHSAQKIARFVLITVILVFGVYMVGWGLSLLWAPESIIESYGIEPKGSSGWSTLHGNFAALITGLGVFVLLGVFSKNTTWLLAALLLELFIFAGRLVGIYSHGSNEMVTKLTVGEGVVICVIFSYWLMQRKLDRPRL